MFWNKFLNYFFILNIKIFFFAFFSIKFDNIPLQNVGMSKKKKRVYFLKNCAIIPRQSTLTSVYNSVLIKILIIMILKIIIKQY